MALTITRRAPTIRQGMATETAEQQLELFGLGDQGTPPRRDTGGQFLFRLRYDQLMLVAIGGVLSVTVVFAGGVERGKQLARSERLLSVRQQTPLPQATTAAAPLARSATARENAAETPAGQKAAGKNATGSGTLRSKQPAQPVVAAVARYAIQVVTYSQPQLAQQELQRLQARGERAFLLKRDGRTIVCVGPFPSPDHASHKLTALRTRYQDCFIKTL